MNKVVSAAAIAAFLSGFAYADLRTGVTILQGQDIVTYRTADTDKQEEVGDTLGSQTGLGWFNDDTSKNRYSSFSVKGDNFGASMSFKLNRNTATSNGYAGYYDLGKLHIGFAGNGLGGFGDVTDHVGGELYGLWYYTESLYQWEVLDGNSPSTRRANRTYDNYTYNGYNMTNAGVPLANKDGGHEFGLSYPIDIQGGVLLLKGVIINDRTSTKTNDNYFGWKNFVDGNLQANWTSPDKKTKASLTFKTEGLTTWYSDSNDVADVNQTKGIDLGICAAVSTSAVKDWRFGLGFSAMGKNLGGNLTSSANADLNSDGLFEASEAKDFSTAYWGYGLNLAASYKWTDWTFTISNQTTLIFLSEYSKALSNANKYGWKPYLGDIVALNAAKKISDTMSGNCAFTYRCYNMNSESEGKAESAFYLTPTVTFTPQRACNLTVGLDMGFENLDSNPRALWGNPTAKVYAYTYPHTITVQVPVTFNITL